MSYNSGVLGSRRLYPLCASPPAWRTTHPAGYPTRLVYE